MVVRMDNHPSYMGCSSCDLVVPDKRNVLIFSPVHLSTVNVIDRAGINRTIDDTDFVLYLLDLKMASTPKLELCVNVKYL